ncbi:MAG: PD-(D/E)XK nuclease family protein [Verrucomicrobia bacterium]|nr:PD-(D/E)XK nuclease family protein [Verrucomicrobiota bacterium]
MQVTFLLGPAGSGKTWRCLAEIRGALQTSPEGLPLLLLAPKQATFQLERQLLADPDLPGYTRLQIVSFERLAELILSELAPPPRVLDEEGRVMVLRALLMRMEREKQLQTFHATARLPGFAQQLSLLLRELQRHQLPPAKLAALAAKPDVTPALAAKLHDLALVLEGYLGWLNEHGLQDANGLLDRAAEALIESSKFKVQSSTSSESGIANPQSAICNLQSAIRLAGLWLDGFAEMTPQELDLLAALVPHCDRATLAFCLDREPADELPWLSTWAVVAQSFRQCRARLAALPDCEVTVETLQRQTARDRFAASPALAHLEAHWTDSRPASDEAASAYPLRVAVCPTPEAEATLAAHEILRHVRAGGRFRDCAVLVRSLDGYHDALRRVFTRYEIPFFLDRREPVAHHPLAELTRSALRTVAFGWKHEDWIGALKTGLVSARDEQIDWLENAALEHGWEGAVWRDGIASPAPTGPAHEAERLRQELVPPFLALAARLSETQFQPTGAQLAEALSELWETLQVESRLEAWANHSAAEDQSAFRTPHSALHSTVWDQMQLWLANLALAFPTEALPLRDWLPILEAGLGGLTVGVIPPALDQVLLGAIDRSRNPDLQLAIILGLNEGVFPAPPPPAVLLTDADRDELEGQRVFLGPNRKLRLGHERYFGYIACTRARRRLVLTHAQSDEDGRALNPSLFIDQVKRMFPDWVVEEFGALEAADAAPSWLAAQHVCELAAPLLRNKTRPAAEQFQSLSRFEPLPPFAPIVEKWSQVAATVGQALRVAATEKLYGQELTTSVSALEDFAACPFKFFVARGLRAEERKQFEADEREQGSFQHEVLKDFHCRVRAHGRRWRDLPVPEACVMIRRSAEDLLPLFRDGIFLASDAARFKAELLIDALEQLIAVLIDWARQCEFDPYAVEVDFGFEGSPLPAWRLPVDAGHALRLRGRIDRIDLCRISDEEALVTVIDYKSRVHPLDATKLQHGLQLQLPSYLSVLRHLENPLEALNVERLTPAGVFYVSLRGESGSGASRAEVLSAAADARRSGYVHTGRFNSGWLRLFDNREDARSGDQFKYRLNKDGNVSANCTEALTPEKFQQFLELSEQHLQRIGGEIFAGNAGVSPYRKNTETACQHCDFRAVCRFDPWVEPYRVLRPMVKT